MSHYWGLKCLKCDKHAGQINYGSKCLRKVVKYVWPVVAPLMKASRENWPWELEVNIYISGNQDTNNDIWKFLVEHESHGISLWSEYGDEQYPEDVLITPRGIENDS